MITVDSWGSVVPNYFRKVLEMRYERELKALSLRMAQSIRRRIGSKSFAKAIGYRKPVKVWVTLEPRIYMSVKGKNER